MTPEMPDGFVLSDAAMYSYLCQEVFGDIVSFAAAIPDHLKPLFLIPIKVERVTTASEVARRVSRRRYADGITPSGNTPEGDLFGTKTFVNDDQEPTVPSSVDESIFRIDDADDITKHQENDQDENIQVPTETSYNSDVDTTEYFEYPYRTDERVTHSSTRSPVPLVVRLALKPEVLEPHAPEKIQSKARACSVSLVSYDKKSRVFTFSVDCGNVPRTVQASMSEIDHVAMVCDCPFWQWNGPEHNAKSNSYLLGQPYGTAGPPDVRDPNREYWMCKHAYAVLRKLDGFVQEITEENWDKTDEELLEEVDEEWDRLEGVSQIPMEEEADEEIEADWEDPEPDSAEEIEAEANADSDAIVEELEEAEEEPEESPEEEEEAEDYSGEQDEEEQDEEEQDEEEQAEEEEDYSDTEEETPSEDAEEEEQAEEEEVEDYSGEQDEEQDEK